MIFRAFLAAAALSSACVGGTLDPSVPDQRYLDYGGKHECVVPIYGECGFEGGGKPHKFAASAVVVSRRWVVTAAHVVKGSREVKVRVNGKEHELVRVVVNRRFDEDKLGMYDIAVAESGDDMELDFYPSLYEGDDEVGKVASVCGYGATGTFGTGHVRSDGRKRAGSNRVLRAENQTLVFSVTDPGRTSMEFMIAPGDSGGGAFIDQRLAGINSFVMATDGRSNSDYGDEFACTRVSMFAPWISAYMNGEDPDEEGK